MGKSNNFNGRYDYGDIGEFPQFPRRSPRSQHVKIEGAKDDDTSSTSAETSPVVSPILPKDDYVAPKKVKKKRGRKPKNGSSKKVSSVKSPSPTVAKSAATTPSVKKSTTKRSGDHSYVKAEVPVPKEEEIGELFEPEKVPVPTEEEIADLFKPETLTAALLNEKELDDDVVDKDEDINEDDEPSLPPDTSAPPLPGDKELDPIVFNESKFMTLQMEYELYLPLKWINLEFLRRSLIENDLPILRGRHPNYQFIYESVDSRKYLIDCLTEALKNNNTTSILDRKSWDNIVYLPGGPLNCPPGVLLNPRKSTVMKGKKVYFLKEAIKSVIVLLYWNVYQTKRSIWYQHFKNSGISQRDSDDLLDDVACGAKVPRPLIHVLSSSKGMIQGNVTFFIHDGQSDIPEGTSIETILTDWSKIGEIKEISYNSAQHIPTKVCKIVDIKSDAKFLLVIEKESTFQTLTETSKFAEEWNCILLTGKGYPDTNTRHLVRLIWSFLQIPILALVDGDPHGFDIYCQYKYGSVSQAYDSFNLTTPQMKLIGVRPSDFEMCQFNDHSFGRLSQMDLNKVRELQQRPYTEDDEDLKIELELFVKYRRKLELQALNVIAIDYLYKEYLPQRLVAGRFEHYDILDRELT